LKPPFRPQEALEKEDDNISCDFRDNQQGSSSSALDDLVSLAVSEAGSSIGLWTVQFVHQAVDDFLRQPGQLDVLFNTAQPHIHATRPRDSGHVLLLRACEFWLQAPIAARDTMQITTTSELIKDVLYHSPKADYTASSEVIDLIADVDYRLSLQCPQREYWPSIEVASTKICYVIVNPGRHFTFLAFAVASNMQRFVQTRLSQAPMALPFKRRSGIPLIFDALNCPGHRADATQKLDMVETLLKLGCDPGATYVDEISGTPLDALAFYLSHVGGHDWAVIKQPFMQITQMLLLRGCNPNGRFRDDQNQFLPKGRWSGLRSSSLFKFGTQNHPTYPLLHIIAGLPLEPQRLYILLQAFVRNGAELNAQDWQGRTLLDVLVQKDTYLTLEVWRWLLENGARVTASLMEGNPSAYELLSENHPLKDPCCREPRYYTWAARTLALKYNLHWASAQRSSDSWMRSISDSVLSMNVVGSLRNVWDRTSEILSYDEG
jgi:hypothetical protein